MGGERILIRRVGLHTTLLAGAIGGGLFGLLISLGIVGYLVSGPSAFAFQFTSVLGLEGGSLYGLVLLGSTVFGAGFGFVFAGLFGILYNLLARLSGVQVVLDELGPSE